MQLNTDLWILVIGMIFEIMILVFIVIFVITSKLWIIKNFTQCVGRIKEIEKELNDVKNASINITQIKETLTDVEQLLKNKK